MAMEIKTLDVRNSEEQETIEFWSQFGWTLKSSQRVYNKDSHLENRGGDTYSVTETVDFTKLVFERDKNGPHYARIVELEEAYFYYNDRLPNKKPEVYDSAQEFALATKPDLRTGIAASLPIILRILGIVLFAASGLLLSLEVVSETIVIPICLVGILAFVASFILAKIFKNSALNKAVRGEGVPAEVLKVRFEKYSDVNAKNKQALDEYNDTVATIAAILNELDTLI